MEEKSPSSKHPNIEALCAKYGSEIVKKRGEKKEPKKLETVTRNALGVMREEGLFAFYLYLQYRWKEGGKIVWPQIAALWQNKGIGPLVSSPSVNREQVIALTGNLNDLLLAREVTERALIYALYGLRAENSKKGKKE